MPGLAGIVFGLAFGVLVAAWAIWVAARSEEQKDAANKNPGEHQPALPDA